MSLQPLLNTPELSNIHGGLWKVLRPPSEIEDLMFSTLLELHEGKETSTSCRFLWAASLLHLHFADPKLGEFISNLSSGFDWFNQANREHSGTFWKFPFRKAHSNGILRGKIWNPRPRKEKGRSFSISCLWEICHWPQGEMGTVGAVSCCCTLIICRWFLCLGFHLMPFLDHSSALQNWTAGWDKQGKDPLGRRPPRVK